MQPGAGALLNLKQEETGKHAAAACVFEVQGSELLEAAEVFCLFSPTQGGFMKYKKLVQSALVLGSLALSGAVLATPSGEMLGNTCAGCHGTHGNTNGPATPGIAGINAEYFVETMKAYRDGKRPSTIMARIAKGYDDAEIDAMAKYFAAQKYRAMPQTADAKLAKTGKQLHDKSCEKCHEKGGSVSEDGGILAGQPMPYLHWTIEDFTSGKREMPKKMQTKMEEVHKANGDDGFKALVNYYGSRGK